MDVYVDFAGPFVESADGCKYACTYTCKLLRVPIIEPVRSLKRLKRGDATQGVLTCMQRSLTVPAMWRPEFSNALFEEMSVLLGIQERAPPAGRCL